MHATATLDPTTTSQPGSVIPQERDRLKVHDWTQPTCTRGVKIAERGGGQFCGTVDNTEQARAELLTLGVPAEAIGLDHLRAFGRGAAGLPNEADTCGRCGHGTAAILPDGTVTPCVFTRTATAGSVHAAPLADVLIGTEFAAQVARLDSLRNSGPIAWPCVPDMCNPQCGPSCSPACNPTGTCRPAGGCVPDYR